MEDMAIRLRRDLESQIRRGASSSQFDAVQQNARGRHYTTPPNPCYCGNFPPLNGQILTILNDSLVQGCGIPTSTTGKPAIHRQPQPLLGRYAHEGSKFRSLHATRWKTLSAFAPVLFFGGITRLTPIRTIAKMSLVRNAAQWGPSLLQSSYTHSRLRSQIWGW